MIERTTVRLPKELLDRARRQAAVEGVTLTALIEDSLRKAVSDRSGRTPANRILSAAIQEIEDIAYMCRGRRFTPERSV